MSEELKPCPFCGSTNVKLTRRLLPLVRCGNCGAEGHAETHEKTAVKVWNTRAQGISIAVPANEISDEAKKLIKKVIVKEENSHLYPNQEIKADAGKWRFSLVPAQIIKDIAEVREYGIEKYGDAASWRQVELDRYADALGRHFIEFLKEPLSKDDESGIEHYKHMACNMAFICELLSLPF